MSLPIMWTSSSREFCAISSITFVHFGLTLLMTITPSRFFYFELSAIGIFSQARDGLYKLLLVLKEKTDVNIRIADIYCYNIHYSYLVNRVLWFVNNISYFYSLSSQKSILKRLPMVL